MINARRLDGFLLPTTIAAMLVGSLASGAIVWSASNAAFTASTRNPGNTWAAAQVMISDDDTAEAMFDITDALPGDSGQNCITATYGGVPATVRLYVAPGGLTGTLGSYVNLTVEQGTGGSFGSCTGFSSETSTTGTMAAFAAARTSHATGFGTWAPTGAETRTYRVSWSLAADNAAANKAAGLTLTWEAKG
jgi:hypothetical protein